MIYDEMYWPGPMRLYDPEVDAGAVLLTGEQARGLVYAYEEAMKNHLLMGPAGLHAMNAASILRQVFQRERGE
jgi:hypothetical protein